MPQLETGMQAPDFSLPATGGQEVSLSGLRGSKVVLYFYSRDNTAGCTNEAREFGRFYSEIISRGAVVLGVSRDSLNSHEKFSAKLELPFLLLSDANATVCNAYGVLKEKMIYGRKTMGVERSTFIIDEQGLIRRIFRKVKVAGHAENIIAALGELD